MNDSSDEKPPKDLTAWERWEMPLLDEQGNEVPREEERVVKPLTVAELEAIREAAREEGHQEGHDAGYQEGLRKGKEEGRAEGRKEGQAAGHKQGLEKAEAETRKSIETKLSELESLMGELLAPIERHQDELESALVNLAIVLARAVIHRELTVDSSQIRNVVTDAVNSLPATRENVKIRINPSDHDWVREVAGRLDAEVAVVEDATIMAGGCEVETRHSLVDYTVEKRFQKTVQAMLEQQLGSAGPGESEELESVMGDLSDFHRDVLDESPQEPEAQRPAPGDDDDHQPG